MKIYIQNEGLFVCGRIKEVRELLIHYKNRHRTVRELIMEMFN